MPERSPYGVPEWNFFSYVWDTTGIPLTRDIVDQSGREIRVITPQTGRVVIFGRLVHSPYTEDAEGEELLRQRGRIMGEWFSPLCPDGELGSVELAVCKQISAEEFSAAFQRGWTET